MTSFDVEAVLSQLTLEEKIGLSAGIDSFHTFPVPRLEIPSVRLSNGPNGVSGTSVLYGAPGAVLPNGTAMASTWNKDILFRSGALAGEEGHSKSVHVVLGPTANIQRGPNGGRAFESFSEDPYLSGIASAEIVKGLQSKNVAATMKHYVGNDLEHERVASNSIITERALREIYLEPFRVSLKHSDPKAFMTAYNKVNGVAASQSKKLLIDILREEWGYNGTVMSDWYGTYSSRESIVNGLDIEMPGPPRIRTKEHVGQQIQSRELHINDLDERVRNVLKLAKYAKESGIPENGPQTASNNTPETASLLREIAGESIVLLKNQDNILPLKKDASVAVIGPNAKYAAYSGGGSASLPPYYTVTPYDGISNKIGSDPKYTIGAYAHKNLPELSTHLRNPETGSTGSTMSFYHTPRGTANRVKFDEWRDVQASSFYMWEYTHKDLAYDDTFYVDIEGTFTPEDTGDYEFGVYVLGTALVFVNDQLVVDNKTKQTRGGNFFSNGTVEERGSIHLEKGVAYNVRIEYGSGQTYTIRENIDFIGNGAIGFGMAKIIDPLEEIHKACEIAKSVNTVVLCIGTSGEWETESHDREDIRLPGYTDELVREVLKVNPNTVIVNQAGSPCEFPWIQEAKGVLQAWFGGNESGNAIADVLYGDVNPSGKLSLTFLNKFEDNPAYLNFHTERGRVLYGEDIFVGYRYYEKLQRQVMFPFGYGLSYTTFKFSGLKVSVDEISGKIFVSVDVENTGTVNGKEVIQVYISKTKTDVIRPVKELKEFEKVSLQAGEKKTVSMDLSLKDSVSYFDEWENKWHVQSGEYSVQVGASSDDIELIDTFEVTKSFYWLGL